MGSLSKAWVTPVSILIVALSGIASAWGQDTTESRQTLDRVDSISRSAVLEMAFEDPDRTADYANLGLGVTALATCQRTPINGLFCLDGNLVRNWPDTAEPTNVVTVFSCADPALGLVTNKPPCITAMTADLAGNIWFSGRKGNSYSLIKVFRKTTPSCPAGGSFSNSANYCFQVRATGRPVMVDLVALDGSVGADFNLGPGVLALEDRKAAVFFGDSPPGTPIVIASGKSAWNLIGNEQLLSEAVFQLRNGASVENYVLATTTTGRVLRRNTASTAAAIPVFNVPAERVVPPLGQCDASTPHYGIRASTHSGIVYVTDRNFCQVIALQANNTGDPPGTPFTALENVPEGSGDLTLSTQASSTEFFPPDGPTIAPGISIELRDCGENEPSCTLLKDNTGAVAAQLSGVILDTGPSDMTLFQIKGIPDCRYLPDNDFCEEKIAAGEQVIIGPAGNPSAQYLNVTPLLPEEIKVVLAASGESPPMLISPLYRGQQANDFIFEGFFGVTDPATRFRETFTGLFDIALLTGEDDLGCGGAGPQPNLNWDVVTMVSERYSSVGGPTGDVVGADKEHADMLANSDCFNPTVPRGVRWSLYSYSLEVAPSGDSVFAKVLDSIYNDLESTRDQLACANNDGGDVAPLAPGVCGALADRWANGRTKLDACLLSSNFPKQSEAVRNCGAFGTQLTNYQSTLAGAARTGIDPANRIGELKARVDVIFHVFEDHFLLSVPPGGFIDPFVP